MLYCVERGGFMHRTQFDEILNQIANANRISPTEVRENLRAAMTAALADPNPVVQAMWQSVPRKGSKPTLEEFMDYLIGKNLLQS